MTGESAAEIARGANEKIREVVERLDGGKDGDQAQYAWFCGCGCMTIVPLTLAAFLAGGAWADGHSRD